MPINTSSCLPSLINFASKPLFSSSFLLGSSRPLGAAADSRANFQLVSASCLARQDDPQILYPYKLSGSHTCHRPYEALDDEHAHVHETPEGICDIAFRHQVVTTTDIGQ